MPTSLLLQGAQGRMGRAIAGLVEEEECRIGHACDAGDDPGAGIGDCEVAVDFSSHEATPVLAGLCAEAGLPLVIGTTGHLEREVAAIREAAARIPMVWAGNYSIGITLLLHLTREAARALPPAYQAEIVEMHHRHKKDAPSGTAENLLDALLGAREQDRGDAVFGRHGLTGERPEREVGVHALRGGEVVGEHTVLFAGPGERVTLGHSAQDRAIFARGALRAARWVIGREPGIYGMGDVLGIG